MHWQVRSLSAIFFSGCEVSKSIWQCILIHWLSTWLSKPFTAIFWCAGLRIWSRKYVSISFSIRIVRKRRFFGQWNPHFTKECTTHPGFYNSSLGENDFGVAPTKLQPPPFQKTLVFYTPFRRESELADKNRQSQLPPLPPTSLTLTNLPWGLGEHPCDWSQK